MATHLDLQEQEQIDSFKHFWNQYGNAIAWVLVLVLGGFAGWNGFQYWQTRQAVAASVLFDEAQRAAAAGDAQRLQSAYEDLRKQYAKTQLAAHVALLYAKARYDAGDAKAAQEALAWVVSQDTDEGLSAVARLRQAGLLIEAKSYEEAMKLLAGAYPPSFQGMVADRKGDVLLLQGKKEEAQAAFEQAKKAMPESLEYRRVVDIKLTALGVDVAPSPAAGTVKP